MIAKIVGPAEMREANEKLLLAALRDQEAADQLRITEAFREQLLGIVGHDLRSPLAAIVAAIDGVTARSERSLEEQELLHGVRETATRMSIMIAQLLDYTRARDSGGFWIVRTKSNLGPLLKSVVAQMALGAMRPGAFIEKYEGDLAGAWDADRLSQVFTNLIDNATRYGTPDTPIQVTALGLGERVIIHVANRGSVIPPETLDSLFDPFRRVRSRLRSKSGGLGFGLFIASEIVNAHGGRLSARSSSRGTRFSVVLPRK